MIYVSPAYERIWGRSCKSLYENPDSFMNSVYDEDKSLVFNEFENYQKMGSFNLEYRIVQPSGEIRWVHARSFPVKNEEGEIIRHTGLAVDITERKKLEEEFRKFKTISDKAGYGSLIHDKAGTITYSNKAFAKLHGYEPEDLLGNSIEMLFDGSKKDILAEIHKDAENHQGFKGKEVYHKHKDGSDIPLLMSSTFIEIDDDKKSFFAETYVDISNLKEAQNQVQQHVEEVEMINQELNVAREQLATLNQDLEKKVKERTAEVDKLLKQKDGFINQLGHDLRTPLTPMLGLLPLLKKRIDDEKGMKYISMIDRNIRFMKDLVNKTITFAKLNSDKIDFSFSKINLHNQVEEVEQQLHATLEKENALVKTHIDESLIVFADEMQLSEVFHNLISNALKYRQKENSPVIEIFTTEKEEDTVQISVKDNGIGMTEDQIDYVFDEFYKADDARTDVDSHGLGLNICKRIINKHGGKIWVESKGPGKGSQFNFTLHTKNGAWNTQYNEDEKEDKMILSTKA
jgi:PAS domain S-box-containing protein